jgi:hypothetical protein
MAYTTINKSSLHFNTKLYAGNSGTQALTGVGFQPDLVWIKNRNDSNNQSHVLYDAVRGVTKYISSNSSGAEGTEAAGVTAFGTDGFTVGNTVTVNTGFNYVAWNWKANGQGSANNDGSINTTYTSANTTAGISIVQYTGTGSNATIGHGLGIAPQAIFVKKTNTAQSWRCGHVGMGWTHGNNLNNDSAAYDSDTYWQDTAPTTSVFSVGTDTEVNGSGATHIAYCFAEVRGFSKFGKYVGNASGSDNAFVYCGFKPAYVLTKCISVDGDRWTVYDNKRDVRNPTYLRLFPDGSIVESANTDADIDLLSNGFKIRTDAGTSGAAQTYIYMAFAKAPLVGSNNVPATAR